MIEISQIGREGIGLFKNGTNT